MAAITSYSLTTTNSTPATGIASYTKPNTDTLVQFAISGTYGTVSFAFECTQDGTNWLPIAARRVGDASLLSGTISPADNTKAVYNLDGSGFIGVRLSVSAIASGTLAVSAQSNAYVGSPLFTSANSSNLGATTVTSLSATGTAGVGYGTGAGSAVTQITSRTTGVTINAPSGAITLVSAAGSATPASFTVTNSAVAATDSVMVSQKSGADLYEIFVTAVAAGSFKITSFTTGGTTTETPVFNFNVIKGSAS